MKRMVFQWCGLVAVGLSAAAADNWPQFRGPNGDGHAPAKQLPLTWSETNHVVWKTPIHDLGWSSPVVWDQQIWVTTATEDGKQAFAVCVDRDTGKVVHDLKVFDTEKPEHVASVNSLPHRRLSSKWAACMCITAPTAPLVWIRGPAPFCGPGVT